jgi:hypothetical protein
MPNIRLRWQRGSITGTLRDTAAAQALLEYLPCATPVNRWGDEIYFSLAAPIALEPEATDVVPPGTICYWVEGRCLAFPFGPTPMSQERECRMATPVTVLGELTGDPRALGELQDGDQVVVEPA